jgi:hypothetical protein
LIVRALALVWRRLPLYAAGAACVIGAQALVALVWRVPFGLAYSSFIVPPLLTTLVYAFAWADSDDAPQGASATWERVLDRAWAVIVIDLVTTILVSTGLNGILAQDPVDIVLGCVILLICAPLVFADTSATVDEMPVWWLLPGAFWRSLRTARGETYLRAIAILAFGLIPALLQPRLLDWMQAKDLANADFWSSVPLNAVTLVPIAVLTALVYRDATRKAPNTETETKEIGD